MRIVLFPPVPTLASKFRVDLDQHNVSLRQISVGLLGPILSQSPLHFFVNNTGALIGQELTFGTRGILRMREKQRKNNAIKDDASFKFNLKKWNPNLTINNEFKFYKVIEKEKSSVH